MFGSKKQSEYFKKLHKQLTQKSIESDILGVQEKIQQILKSNETEKVKETMDVVKKIIKQNIEAKYKFFSLLILNELMRFKKDYISNYFVKKMSDRLINIAKHRYKKKGESLEQRGATCLNRLELGFSFLTAFGIWG